MGATITSLNDLLNYNFGKQTYSVTIPSTMYFGLSTTLVTTAGYTSITEPTVGSYARVSYSNSIHDDATTPGWTTSTTGTKSNNTAVTFPKSTASWGTILSLFIIEVSTGNVLWFKTLSPAIVVQNHTTVSFPAGDIVATFTDSNSTTVTLNDILNYNFGKQAYSVAIPNTMYFGLSTSTVTSAGFSSVTEPSGNGYARATLANSTSGWNNAAGGITSNKLAITFPTCTPATWGTIASIFIADSAVGGTNRVLWFDPLNPTVEILPNDTYSVDIGAFIPTLT